ncbi:hypothetical protein [Tunicatimonas pelagia]|uniref:hypothetical protein n=1 Tax=Tunicatimonas pelagia TaxID=931531 RepID=UPI0026666E78|nr:hypothetical protein [Tunicatimonas pelagia]WKN46026.1 hypothetical protein P0M28_13810 [Tunicatimonas pelagia]
MVIFGYFYVKTSLLFLFAKYSIGVLLLLANVTLFAQDKIEVERTVSSSQVPSAARAWLHETYSQTPRLRWYLEKSSGETSYEAKLRHRGAWHSVEFGEDGVLQDIEIIVRMRDLPKAAHQGIVAYLDTTYIKHRIRKIQQQLTGSPEVVRAVVQGEPAEEVTYRYEIEFYGKNRQSKALWEGLFDGQGQLQERKRIILRPTDNLLY